MKVCAVEGCDGKKAVRWSTFKWVASIALVLTTTVGGGAYSMAVSNISDVEKVVTEQGKVQAAQTAEIRRMREDIKDIKEEQRENNKEINDKLDKLIERMYRGHQE